jgi:hypothetical protein
MYNYADIDWAIGFPRYEHLSVGKAAGEMAQINMHTSSF